MSEMEAQLSDIETGRCFACAQLFSADEELSSHVMEMHADDGTSDMAASPSATD